MSGSERNIVLLVDVSNVSDKWGSRLRHQTVEKLVG